MTGEFQQCPERIHSPSDVTSGIKDKLVVVSRILSKWLNQSQTVVPGEDKNQNEDTSEPSGIPWVFILICLLVGSIIVAIIVLIKFRIATKTFNP